MWMTIQQTSASSGLPELVTTLGREGGFGGRERGRDGGRKGGGREGWRE